MPASSTSRITRPSLQTRWWSAEKDSGGIAELTGAGGDMIAGRAHRDQKYQYLCGALNEEVLNKQA